MIQRRLKIDNVTQTHASGTGQIISRDAASCISACLLLNSGFCCFYLFWRYVNESAVAPRPHTLHMYLRVCVQSTPIQKTLMTCDYGNKIMRCFIGRRTIKRWQGKKKASLSLSLSIADVTFHPLPAYKSKSGISIYLFFRRARTR